MPDFDVLVCGAGPGGAYAAFRMAKDGFTVGLLEKGKLGRDKSCGGILSHRIRNFPEIFDEDAEYIESSCYRAILYDERGNGCEIKWDSPIAWNTRRTIFDKHVVEVAQEEGVTFLPGHKVNDVTVDSDQVTLGVGQKEISAKVVIGAGGANCPISKNVRTSLGFWEKWPPRSMATAVVEEIPFPRSFIEEHYGDGLTLVHVNFGNMPLGYGWVFPKRDVLNIGYGTFTEEMKNLDVRETFREYLRILVAQGHLPYAPEVLHIHGAPIPWYAGLQTTVMDRILLIGDSAGFVNPFNGEGITYSVESAQYAADTIARVLPSGNLDSKSLMLYENKWRAGFGAELKWLLRFYPMLYRHSKALIYACAKSPKFAKFLAEAFAGKYKVNEVRYRVYMGVLMALLKPVPARPIKHSEEAVMLCSGDNKNSIEAVGSVEIEQAPEDASTSQVEPIEH